RTAGMERSCSGVTIRTPSARAISFLKRSTSGGRLASVSWLYIGRSSMRAKAASNLPAPSRMSAWASLRLMESRRFEPTITARRGKCIESSMVECSDHHPLTQQWNTSDRSVSELPRQGASFGKVLGLRLEVNYMNGLPLENDAACNSSTRARETKAPSPVWEGAPVGGFA